MVAMAYEWNENTREDDDGLLYALGFTIITDMIRNGIMKMLPLQVHPSTLMPSHTNKRQQCGNNEIIQICVFGRGGKLKEEMVSSLKK